jgi:tetratricopeptide (TPR) repeat protein
MLRKLYTPFFLSCLLLLAASVLTSAQTLPVGGTVEVAKADGTREPVAGALIEVYRTDIKAGAPSAKTGKKGDFAFVGLPFGGTYTFAISAPGCAPTVLPGVKAGQEKLVITLTPGDGSKISEIDARNGAGPKSTGTSSGELTADQKKEQAEYERKKAEIEAKNKNIETGDAIARQASKDGTAALEAKNFDLAIASFDKGIEAVPDFVGSTPVLLNGKMIALKSRGFNVYREGAAIADPASRRAKYEIANKDYDAALVAFGQAMDVVKKAEPPADAVETKRRETLTSELYALATEIHRLKAVGNVDTSKGAEAYTLITAYIPLETDPAKKLIAQMTLGDIMRLTGDFGKAVEAYRQVLAVKPDHPEAMAGLGLSLFAQGAAATPEDKAMEQEGLNFMQKYTEIAPVSATDSQTVKDLKVSVKETVEYLKAQKMTPQKLPSTPKKKP